MKVTVHRDGHQARVTFLSSYTGNMLFQVWFTLKELDEFIARLIRIRDRLSK